MTDAYRKGYNAHGEGDSIYSNPYEVNDPRHYDWQSGFEDAVADYQFDHC